jgi:hypothetical protein
VTKYLSLVIKGEPPAAADACREHCLEGVVGVSQTKRGETIIRVKDSRANLDKIFDWFIAPVEHPYPLGTLLHYEETEQ